MRRPYDPLIEKHKVRRYEELKGHWRTKVGLGKRFVVSAGAWKKMEERVVDIFGVAGRLLCGKPVKFMALGSRRFFIVIKVNRSWVITEATGKQWVFLYFDKKIERWLKFRIIRALMLDEMDTAPLVRKYGVALESLRAIGEAWKEWKELPGHDVEFGAFAKSKSYFREIVHFRNDIFKRDNMHLYD